MQIDKIVVRAVQKQVFIRNHQSHSRDHWMYVKSKQKIPHSAQMQCKSPKLISLRF